LVNLLSEHEEESEITLEEEIHILQEQHLPPEKIVERILEENFNADINILSDTLKLDKLVIGRIKGRLSRLRKRRAEKEAPTAPSEAKPEEGPLYKGELDTTAILRDILTHHPDIPEKVVNEVCSWAEYGPIHPTQLVSLLQSFRGITVTTAYIVAQKYSLALQKAQQEGKLTVPPLIGGPMPGTSQPPWGFPTGFPQQQQPPTGLPQPSTSYVPPFGVPQPPAQTPSWGYPPLTEERIRTIFREERQPKESREPEQFVEIEDPARDNTGNVILDPQDRPIMKKMRVPASQASQFTPKEDTELRVLDKLEKYKRIFGSELTEEKIREIMREEKPPQPTEGAPSEKPVTLEDVRKVSTEASQAAVKQVLDAHEKEDKEEKRHQETLKAIRESGSGKAVEGYKEDSFRILGQGMSEAARVVGDRKPVEVIIREGGRLVFGGGEPGKEVQVGAGEGLLKRLQDRGWVVEH